MKGFWKFFRPSRGTSSQQKRIDRATNEALHQLGNAPDWKQMYHILKEWNKVLLTEQAFAFIKGEIARFEREGDILSLTDWRQILTMLQDARTNGIDEAWERFMQCQEMARVALNRLLNATSDEKRYIVLKIWQAILTSDASIVELFNKTSRAKEGSDFFRAMLLQRQLHLLLECRDYGLVRAWKNYTLHKELIVKGL